MNILIIGLGPIGLGVTKNLSHTGKNVFVYDRNEHKINQAICLGGKAISDLDPINQPVDTVLIFVTTGEQALLLVSQLGDARFNLPPGALVLLGTTTSPDIARSIEKECELFGFDFVECPVSGGAVGAHDGTLTVIAAGRPDAAERAKRVLATASREFKYVGQNVGDASRMKMVNQLLVAINLAGAAEVMAFAMSVGLDRAQVFDVLSSCAGNSWIWQDRMRRFVGLDKTVRSKLSTLMKDIEIARLEIGDELTNLSLFEKARELVSCAIASGLADADDTILVEYAAGKFRQTL